MIDFDTNIMTYCYLTNSLVDQASLRQKRHSFGFFFITDLDVQDICIDLRKALEVVVSVMMDYQKSVNAVNSLKLGGECNCYLWIYSVTKDGQRLP